MEIVWTDKALDSLKENLEFWDIHNETPSYSDKILAEINKLTSELSDNPLYLGRYNKELNLYVRPILKSRFLKIRREKILLKFNSSKVQNKNLFSNTKGLWFIINN